MAGFGFGNFIKPQATPVRPGDLPGFKDLSMQEKLMMLGSAMRGDMAGAQQIPMLAAARARQAQQMGLDQEFNRFLSGEGVPTLTKRDRPAIAEAPEPEADPVSSAASGVIAGLGGLDGVPIKRDRVNVDIPQFGVIPGEKRQGPPSLRDALPLLMKRRAAGMDIKTDIDLLDKVGPDIKYERGIRYDARDPSSAPKEIVDVEKGQQRVFDAIGNVIGVMNAKGYVQSVAELERAKAEATEGVKAGLDVGVYEDADGIPRRMTRAQAAAALNGSVPMVGGGTMSAPALPGSAQRGAPDISRGQSAAEKIAAEGRAKTAVEVEAMTPKAKSALETMNRKSDFVLGVLDELLGERVDPKTGKTLKVGDPMVRGGLGGTAGLNELTKVIPGTASRNLDAKLDTLRATLGFAELQTMRDNSPTGGAVGNLTERELALLSSLIGSLDQGQDPDQLLAILRKQRDELRKVSGERKRAFDRQFGAGRAPKAASGSASYTAEDRARAAEILRQRRAARGEM